MTSNMIAYIYLVQYQKIRGFKIQYTWAIRVPGGFFMVGSARSARTAPSPPPPQSLPTENHKIAFTYLILVSEIYTQTRFKLENVLLI